jgi:hypothetical protein
MRVRRRTHVPDFVLPEQMTRKARNYAENVSERRRSGRGLTNSPICEVRKHRKIHQQKCTVVFRAAFTSQSGCPREGGNTSSAYRGCYSGGIKREGRDVPMALEMKPRFVLVVSGDVFLTHESGRKSTKAFGRTWDVTKRMMFMW